MTGPVDSSVAVADPAAFPGLLDAGRAHPIHPAFRAVDPDPGIDLPMSTDARQDYPRLTTVLASAALPVVLVTAGGRVGPGFAFSDVVALVVAFVGLVVASTRVNWTARPQRWLFAITAVQILFVASLDTLTGGGPSPYFALYAPVLALAGWHLRGDLVALAVILTGVTEVWRAVVFERSGDAVQVTIALPFFGALAALAWLTAHRLTGAVATIRESQVRTAAVLRAVRSIGADPADDPLAQLVTESEACFGCEAGLVTFSGEVVEGVAVAATSEAPGHLRIPVTGSRGNHAVLQISRSRPFSVNEIRLVEILTGAAAKAADGRWLLDRIRAESERDGMTGLWNRRTFDRDLAAVFEPATDGASDAVWTLYFVDVNDFKAYNDAHGHDEGDAALRAIADGLLATMRHTDRVYRFGGDEFAILAAGLSADEATARADRIAAIAGRARRRHDELVAVLPSLAVGLARTGPGIGDAAELLRLADQAMYVDKRRHAAGIRASLPGPARDG